LQAAVDYAIDCIERSDHQRGIDNGAKDGQRARSQLRPARRGRVQGSRNATVFTSSSFPAKRRSLAAG
jgi:hypothetical protein